MLRRAGLVGLAMAVCLLLIAPVAAAAHGLQVVRLSEVVRSIFYAPQYVALALGFFEDEGLSISMSTAWGADKGAAALISGSVEIGFSARAAIYIYNQAQGTTSWALVTTMDGSFFMKRGQSEEFDWEEVRGKTIVRAGLEAFGDGLGYVLRQHGITPFEDVDIITNLAFAAAPGAFQAGLGDYIAQFEPSMTQLEMAGAGKIVASMGLEGGPITYTLYHARRDYIEENRDVLVRFTRALYRGMEWVEEHSPEETAKVIQGFFPDTDLEVIIKITGGTGAETWNPTRSWRETEHLQTVMEYAGELEERVPFDALMDNSIALEAIGSEN